MEETSRNIWEDFTLSSRKEVVATSITVRSAKECESEEDDFIIIELTNRNIWDQLNDDIMSRKVHGPSFPVKKSTTGLSTCEQQAD